ncbi:hypothetical protein [Sphingobium nicotianae]|uniref:Alpha/beta hydrolase n=1 Tax=Sphingobium nicotianae TaxID=2782607 RepID=A0A9X1IQE3_9SPHN|nr:hypothetical protein [Sphingobium nicotianae]MBT2186556.1 hypothetical protein [Sphingobium nicotianae]
MNESQLVPAGSEDRRSGSSTKLAHHVERIPAEVFNVNARDRDWVAVHAPAAGDLPAATPAERRAVADCAKPFHLCVGWGDTPFTRSYDRAKARGWTTSEIACGHDVMLDHPEALTAELLGVASAAG